MPLDRSILLIYPEAVERFFASYQIPERLVRRIGGSSEKIRTQSAHSRVEGRAESRARIRSDSGRMLQRYRPRRGPLNGLTIQSLDPYRSFELQLI